MDFVFGWIVVSLFAFITIMYEDVGDCTLSAKRIFAYSFAWPLLSAGIVLWFTLFPVLCYFGLLSEDEPSLSISHDKISQNICETDNETMRYKINK